MTRWQIAISLPMEQLARAQQEVRAGRADSVSGYIAQVLAEREKRESLRVLMRDVIEQHGEPDVEDTSTDLASEMFLITEEYARERGLTNLRIKSVMWSRGILSAACAVASPTRWNSDCLCLRQGRGTRT